MNPEVDKKDENWSGNGSGPCAVGRAISISEPKLNFGTCSNSD